jgi:2-keto-3-deoxy-L-rhamnonate aldolase RhmA
MPAIVRNVAREKLEQGQLSLGVGVRMTRSVEIAKAMAIAGFDWLFLDMEHGVMSLEACAQISTAALDGSNTRRSAIARWAASGRITGCAPPARVKPHRR